MRSTRLDGNTIRYYCLAFATSMPPWCWRFLYLSRKTPYFFFPEAVLGISGSYTTYLGTLYEGSLLRQWLLTSSASKHCGGQLTHATTASPRSSSSVATQATS